MATSLDRTWYKAWHAWALANSEVVSHFAKSHNENEPIPTGIFTDHLVPSLQGRSLFQSSVLRLLLTRRFTPVAFFKSIALSPGNSLQDTLRLLTLWFKYGGSTEVTNAVIDGFKTVTVDTWLEVIPQVSAKPYSTLTELTLSFVSVAYCANPCP